MRCWLYRAAHRIGDVVSEAGDGIYSFGQLITEWAYWRLGRPD